MTSSTGTKATNERTIWNMMTRSGDSSIKGHKIFFEKWTDSRISRHRQRCVLDTAGTLATVAIESNGQQWVDEITFTDSRTDEEMEHS